MDAKEYLEQIAKLDELIADKKDEIQRQNDIADGIGGFNMGERVQSTRNLHKMSDAVHESIDLQREVDALSAEREAIIETIKKLPVNEYKVIYRIYVKGYLLKQVAAECKKSYIWAKKMHKKGLDDVQSMIDNA